MFPSHHWPMRAVAVAAMMLSAGCISTHTSERSLNAGARGPMSATVGQADNPSLRGDSTSAQSFYDEARRQIALQQWVPAMQWLDRALVIDPSHVEALNARASLRAQHGDLSGAHADLRAAIGIDPSRAHLHFNLGLVHQLRADQPAARQAFERAVELDPFHERARLAMSSGMPSSQPVPASAASPPAQAAAVGIAVSQPREAAAPVASTTSAHDSLVRIASADVAATARDPDRVRVESSGASPNVTRSDVVVVRASPQAQIPVDAQEATAEAGRLDARIAIANGNGVAGLARALKLQLAQVGPYSTTTRNWVNFEQRETRVYHRPGFEIVALKVSQALPVEVPTAVLPSASMGGRDVLVILGQDIKALSGTRMKGSDSLAELPTATSSLVSSRALSKEATGVSKL